MTDQNEYENLLERFTEFLRQQQDKVPFNFNVLDEQCGHIVENSHTNMLMKLLQYRSSRGYVFLEDFLSYLDFDIRVDSANVVKFLREAPSAGMNKNGRIDGLVYQKNNFVIIIENKVNGAANQKEQLKKYIEGVCSNNNILDISLTDEQRYNRVWVVFLTKDGAETPDKDSVKVMQTIGICYATDNKEDELSGPRYAAVNYRDHILPWLKDNIQPCVMQKEQVLNTGLLQYIDFLEGLLGIRQSENNLMNECRKWLSEQLQLPNDIKDANHKLGELKTFLTENRKNTLSRKNDRQEELLRSTNILLNLIEELNQQSLALFYEVTRRYFTERLEGALMKECCIHNIFNYYYIQIRDTSWPRSIHFEWYPLGLNKLYDKSEYQLCFHVESVQRVKEMFNDDNSLAELFRSQGFLKSGEDISGRRNLTFVKQIQASKPIMRMTDSELDSFLNDAYKGITKEIIERINSKLSELTPNLI